MDDQSQSTQSDSFVNDQPHRESPVMSILLLQEEPIKCTVIKLIGWAVIISILIYWLFYFGILQSCYTDNTIPLMNI